jgi:hypothetical protein
MTTRRTDPRGFSYDTEYNKLQEKTRWTEPLVTLRNGQQVRYETRCIYDGAGNKVMERRSNIDLDGGLPANAWIDRSRSYDDVNNLLSERIEVDDNDANDLPRGMPMTATTTPRSPKSRKATVNSSSTMSGACA